MEPARTGFETDKHKHQEVNETMNKKRSNGSYGFLLACGIASSALVAAGEATYTEKDGYYVFDVSGTDTYSGSLSGANGVKKTGTGTLTFTAANSYTGELVVEQGTLAASTPANFGSMKKITVKEGATLDISTASSSDTSVSKLSAAHVYLSGTGVGGQGAIKRLKGGAINGVFAAMTLEGDATINISSRWGITGTLNLNGHALTRIGSDHGVLISATVNPDADDAKGSILSMAGDFNMQNQVNLNGSADNVLELRGGRAMLYQTTGLKPWTFKFGSNCTLEGCGDGTGRGFPSYNIWSGPVVIPAGVTGTFKTSTATNGLRMAGPVAVNGFVAFDGAGYIEFSGGYTNLNSGLTISAGKDIVFNGGRHLISHDTALSGSVSYLGGARVEMSGNGFHYVYGSKQSGACGALVVSNATLVGSGGNCKLFPGKGNDGYGYFRLGEGAVLFDYSVIMGCDAGSIGAMYMDGGQFTHPNALTVAETSYFYFGIGGGVCKPVSNAAKGLVIGPANFGVFHQSGGLYTDGDVTIAKNGGSGEMYISGGTNNCGNLLLQGATAGGMTAGTALLAVSGSNTVLNADHNFTKVERENPSVSILSVSDGATLKTGRMFLTAGARAAGAEFHVGFDGGVVCPMILSDFFNTGNYTALPTSFVIYDGGMTVDTTYTDDYQGHLNDSFFCAEFKRPTGLSVKTIELPTSDEYLAQAGKYVGSPKVTISGVGKAAAAVAIFDSKTRAVTGIKVVSPGFDYDNSTTATIGSWDGKSEYACVVTVEAQKCTGGICKRGKQGLYLNCSISLRNTFGGPVEALEGGIYFDAGATSFPDDIGLIVHPGAEIGIGSARTVKFVNGAGKIRNGNLTVTDSMCLSTNGLEIAEQLKIQDGVALSIDSATPIAEDAASVTLVTAKELVCDPSKLAVSGLPDGWRVKKVANQLVAKKPSGLCVIVR